jgi:hypothetical protein
MAIHFCTEEVVVKRHDVTMALAAMAWALAAPALAQDDQAAELAKKLSNPVASLISVPIQYNLDNYGGANDGASVSRLVFQPVLPFSLNEEEVSRFLCAEAG